jgi:hypothetical protein
MSPVFINLNRPTHKTKQSKKQSKGYNYLKNWGNLTKFHLINYELCRLHFLFSGIKMNLRKRIRKQITAVERRWNSRGRA